MKRTIFGLLAVLAFGFLAACSPPDHVVETKDGKWRPQAGYTWIDTSDPDKGVHWTPGLLTPEHIVAGLKEVGLSLFVWGIVATSVPLIIAVYLGHYVFKFHPAILFGACAGVRTTTAALGMIQEAAGSKVPALGYGMPYAIGNTLLTIFGMAIVLMM